jgi:GNAT superfamily N-acetyltransferase
MSEPLANGYHDLAPGKLAAVVTSLEMTGPAPLRPEPDPGRFNLRREAEPDAAWYRALFARMGRDWLWFSRLNMGDAELKAVIGHKDVQVYALEAGGRDEGLLELDFREPGVCELAFFAVSREVRGTGAGRWLMNRAIERAWRAPIGRFWVHTCTLDHPNALGFYQRSGFRAFARRVEVADDPRLTGRLPPDAAPEIPTL